MKADLREIRGAPTWMRAEAASSVFIETYGSSSLGPPACLTEDREALLAF
jgi:hypothetical protein